MQKNPNVWSVETEKIAKNLTLRSVTEMRLQCPSHTIHRADPQQLKAQYCTFTGGVQFISPQAPKTRASLLPGTLIGVYTNKLKQSSFSSGKLRASQDTMMDFTEKHKQWKYFNNWRQKIIRNTTCNSKDVFYAKETKIYLQIKVCHNYILYSG